MSRLGRGDVHRLSPAAGNDPKRARAYVIVSRQTLLDSKADKVICAPVNTRYDGLATQVRLGAEEGLKHDSAINCDQLVLIEKGRLTNYLDSLSAAKRRELWSKLRIALDVE